MPDPTSPSPIRSTTCRGLIPDSQQVSSHTSESSDVCLALQGVRTCTDSQDLSRGLSSSLNTKTFTFFRLLRELLVCICCNIHILCIRHKKKLLALTKLSIFMEDHLKFWNPQSFDIPNLGLLLGRQTKTNFPWLLGCICF